MTTHTITLGPSRFNDISNKRLRFVTMRRSLATRIEAGDRLEIEETVPDGSKKTGWRMECTITHVATSLTMPGFLDRDIAAVSLAVLDVYPIPPAP